MTMPSLWSKFCTFSDYLLNSNIRLYFLSSLHPSRPTQHFLKQLQSSSINLSFHLPLQILASLFYILRRFRFVDQNQKSIAIRFYKENAECIVFSHFISSTHLHQNDFYFSPIISELVARGKQVQTIYISPQKSFSKLLNSQPTLNIFFPVLSPPTLIPYLEFLASSLFSLLSCYFSSPSKYPNSFFLVTLKSIFSFSTFYNFYLHDFIRNLHLPDDCTYFSTFEGHSWERVLFSAFRSFYKSSLGIAYQHTLVFENNYSLLRSSLTHLNPNIILVSGSAQLQTFRKAYSCPIKLIGTHKYTAPRTPTEVCSAQSQCYSILFLPQGLYHETLEHLCLALSIASAYPELSIIFRIHPLISYSQLVLQLPRKYFSCFSLPNFSFHFCSLIESLRTSNFAIYSGSTAILEAIQLGIVPIYYSSNTNPSFIDPLWQSSSPVATFSCIEEFSYIYNILPSLTVSRDLKVHVDTLMSPYSSLSYLI